MQAGEASSPPAVVQGPAGLSLAWKPRLLGRMPSGLLLTQCPPPPHHHLPVLDRCSTILGKKTYVGRIFFICKMKGKTLAVTTCGCE